MVMSTNNSIECPVDFIPVNENKVRIIASQVFIISSLYVFTAYWPLIVFLLLDFFVRGFGSGKFSILSVVASAVIKLFSIGNKPIDQAPKLFAARTGIVLSIAILVFHTEFSATAMIFGVLCSVSSFLESFAGFCAGCYLYSLGKKLFPSSE